MPRRQVAPWRRDPPWRAAGAEASAEAPREPAAGAPLRHRRHRRPRRASLGGCGDGGGLGRSPHASTAVAGGRERGQSRPPPPRGCRGSTARGWLGEAEVAVRGTGGRRVVLGRRQDLGVSVARERRLVFFSSRCHSACLPCASSHGSYPHTHPVWGPLRNMAFPSRTELDQLKTGRESAGETFCMVGLFWEERLCLRCCLLPGEGRERGEQVLFYTSHWKENFTVFYSVSTHSLLFQPLRSCSCTLWLWLPLPAVHSGLVLCCFVTNFTLKPHTTDFLGSNSGFLNIPQVVSTKLEPLISHQNIKDLACRMVEQRSHMEEQAQRGLCSSFTPTTLRGLPLSLPEARGLPPWGHEVSYVSPFQNSLILLLGVYVMEFPLPYRT